MRNGLVAFISALVLGACAMGAHDGDAPTTEPEPEHWLAGCWEHLDAASREVWIDAGSGLLFGHAVTLRDGQVRAFEDLRIQPGAAGATYVASPNGGTPVAFAQVDATVTSMTFENPAHDYPQRIAYVRQGDRLTATISNADGSNAIEIAMRRCS